MKHIGNSIVADGNLTRALKRIRRRLAEKRWEIDAKGRIRCELLPPVEGYPARMCCPLGMLAVKAPRTRLERTLGERANAEWKATVEALVDIEVRDHARTLRQQPNRSQNDELYTERNLVRLGVGLAVSTAPSEQAAESILVMEPATIRVLSDATDQPDSVAGILLTRSLSTESNALAEDFRKHFRKTVEEAAAASRAARSITRRRVRQMTAVHDESNGIDGAPAEERAGRARGDVARGTQRLQLVRLVLDTRIQNGIGFIAGIPAAAIRVGVGLWRMLAGRSRAKERVQLVLRPDAAIQQRSGAGATIGHTKSAVKAPPNDSTT